LIAHEGLEKKRAIAVATATRAKPIMLTAIAIILGSLLLATDPIFGGLGVALIFGSIAATLVSLYFIPVLMDNAKALMPHDHEFEYKERSSTWCILTDNLKSLFPRKKEEKNEDKNKKETTHNDNTLLYEGYECKETDRTTWCTLIDKIKSFFPGKYETKPDEKHTMILSSLIDKVKSIFNLKTEDAIDQAYEKAKAERDFINLHNMGNKQFQKKDLDRAIEAYEEALKIKEDKGTSFKLELAKLQKEKEEKKQDTVKEDKNKDKSGSKKDDKE
jgi:tetratricopeptide (TPR) repeat protein